MQEFFLLNFCKIKVTLIVTYLYYYTFYLKVNLFIFMELLILNYFILVISPFFHNSHVVFGLSRRAPFPKIGNSVLFSTSLSILLFFIVLFFTLFLPYSESWRNTKSTTRSGVGPVTIVVHIVEIVIIVRISRAHPPISI